MSGGGKGGSETTTIEIDPRLEQLGVSTGVGALRTAALPFRPTRGVQIAAFTPQQEAAMMGASAAAAALGLPSATPTVMPRAKVNSMGIVGYDPGDMFAQRVRQTFTDEDITARENIRDYYSGEADRIQNMPAQFRSGGGGGK